MGQAESKLLSTNYLYVPFYLKVHVVSNLCCKARLTDLCGQCRSRPDCTEINISWIYIVIEGNINPYSTREKRKPKHF